MNSILCERSDEAMKLPKVLVITGSFGNGHLKVTSNLVEELSKHQLEVVVHDLFLEAHPNITKVAQTWYINSFTYFRTAYKMFYYNKPEEVDKCFYNRYGLKRLTYLIDEHQPDLILSTFPTPVLRYLKRNLQTNIPIHTVITDYRFHKNWLIKDSDFYYVGSEALKNELISHGFDDKNIELTGIPIDAKFTAKVEKKVWLKNHGLNPNKETVLVATGAFGVVKGFQSTVEEIALKRDRQVVVICGKNISLKSKLELAFEYYDNVLILGFTQHMSEWMAACDLLITKPGGITITEALTRSIPMILFSPAPGQEKENALLFQQQELARIANTKKELVRITDEMMTNIFYRKRMSKNMAFHSKPYACRDITDHVVHTLNVQQKNYQLN